MIRVPTRTIRYAVIANYAIRDALRDIDVDLTTVETTIQEKVDQLSAKVDSIIERLEQYDENNVDDVEAEQKMASTKAGRAGARKPKARKKGRPSAPSTR